MKRSRLQRSMAYFLALAMILSFSVPGQTISANAAAKKYVKSLTVDSKVSVKKGKKKTVKVKVKTVKKASTKVTVTVKDKSVAKVTYSSSKNTITISGKKVGKTTVTVTTKAKNKKGKKLSKKITVTVTGTTTSTTQAPAPATTTQTPVVTTPGTATQTPVVPQEVKVTSIVLSQTTLGALKGSKASLSATALPENAADKTIEWSSSNTAVATVATDGTLNLRSGGTATITATNPASGVSASCQVTVLDKITVTSQEQLEDALENAKLGEITLNLASGEAVSIPEGEYEDTVLIINGEEGVSIANAANFSSVTLNGGDYTEKANNTLNINGASSVQIAENASSTITVHIQDGTKEDTVSIENNGTIASLAISSGATVRVTGTATDTITTSVSDANVKLVSNQNMKVSTTAPAELVFTGDVDDTTVTIDNADSMPTIAGVGTIEVTNSETGEKKVVTAQTSDELEKVTITGDVVDAYASGDALQGVKVSLVAASVVLGSDNASGDASGDAASGDAASGDAIDGSIADLAGAVTTSNENGKYTFEEVPGGNYYLVMQKEGYKDAIQLIAASARYNAIFTNEKMEMLRSDVTDNSDASVSGTVKDAANKDGVAGLTVELRKNKGNIIGSALLTTTTDEYGDYSFNGLEAEQYTLRFVDNRADVEKSYISKYVNVCVKSGEQVQQNATVSTSIEGDGVRFVLTWNGEGDGVPRDLDSHIFGPRIGASGMHEVYFSAQRYGLGEAYTSLDVDEMEYNGPETITINKSIDGVYYYYVYQYSSSGALQTSGAKVEVYMGDSLLTTYNVPTDSTSEGRWWKVCSYNSNTGRIHSFNKIESTLSVSGLEGESDGSIGNSACYHGMEKLLLNVTSSDEDALVQKYLYDTGYGEDGSEGQITLTGTTEWETMKQTLSYELLNGYTSEFVDGTDEEDSNYRGQLIVKKGEKQITVYNIYYRQETIVAVSGSGLTKYSYDYIWRELNLYLVSDSINVKSLTYTCSDSDYTCAWENDCLYMINNNDATDKIQIYVNGIYTGYYISDMVGSGIRFFDEYDDEVDIYTDTGNCNFSDIEITCAEGYRAEVQEDDGDVYIVIYDSTNTVVTKKYVYVDVDDY